MQKCKNEQIEECISEKRTNKQMNERKDLPTTDEPTNK
jgi:hypothetical protein